MALVTQAKLTPASGRQPGAALVQGNDLTVKDSVLAFEVSGNLCREAAEGCEGVSIPRDQLTLAVLEVSECPESIELQLENPVRMVKGVRLADKPHG
jgi:hypothetical protein